MAGLMFAEVPHVGSDSLVADVHAVVVLVVRVLPPPLCVAANIVRKLLSRTDMKSTTNCPS